MGTGISWTDETAVVDRGGRRVRIYHRQNPDSPGIQLRRRMRASGLRWCRGCQDWLPLGSVTRQGLCRPHANEEYRRLYAAAPEAARARSTERKRGVAAVPAVARECLTERFGGRCAYCPAPATTWDHLVPVKHGGGTVPGNIVPACASCNSSKGTRDVIEWLSAHGRVASHDLLDVLALVSLANAEVA